MRGFGVILLDLDGTLVDASEPILDGVRELAGDHGLRVPDRAWLTARIGSSPEETWRLLGAPDPVALAAEFGRRYADGLPARTRLLDGALHTVQRLHREGRALAVATTRETSSARQTLAAVGMLGCMGAVVGRDQVAHPKPAPDVLLRALQLLGARPEGALMVGDTPADVGAAQAAGVACWAVLGGFADEATLRAAGSQAILSGGIADLPEALARADGRPA